MVESPGQVTVPNEPTQAAMFLHKPTLAFTHLPSLASSMEPDSFMVGAHSATPRLNNHQLMQGYNAPVSDPRRLLPCTLRRSVTCPSVLPSKRTTELTADCDDVSLTTPAGNCVEGNLDKLQLQWQQKQEWLEQHGGEDCGFINPERLLQHQQKSRSLHMLMEHESLVQ